MLFDGLVAQSLEGQDRKGCLLVNTASDLPNQDTDVARIVKAGMRDFEGFFEGQIALGQAKRPPADCRGESADAGWHICARYHVR